MSEKNAKLLSVLKLQPVVPVLVIDDLKTAVLDSPSRSAIPP